MIFDFNLEKIFNADGDKFITLSSKDIYSKYLY